MGSHNLLHEIATAMGGKVQGNRALFPTPGHSKGDLGSWASLSPGAPDGVLVHCSNGGDALAIKDELRQRGILPPYNGADRQVPWRPASRERKSAPQHAIQLRQDQRIVATFEYIDADGALLYRKHRIEPGDEGRSKTFRFDRPNGSGGWISGQGDDRVPYRLSDLVGAPRDLPIYMAEGEAKADRLAEWGLLATSHKDWKSFEFSGFVRGRTVIILPDNDKAGLEQAQKAAEGIERAEGTPYILNLPGLPDAGDILDWDGSLERLLKLAEDVRKCDGSELLQLDDAADWAGLDVPPRRWLLTGWLPMGEAALFTGPGSVGKSLLAQQFAVTIAAGRPFFGLECQQAASVYITCEDGQEEVQRRHKAIAESVGVPLQPGRCLVKSWKGELDLELAVFDAQRRMMPTDRFRALRRTTLAVGARLVVLDNTSHLFGGDENVKREVAAFANLLNGLAEEIDGVVLILGHPNKTGLNKPEAGDANQFGGSVAWENQFRSRMFMSFASDIDHDARELSNPKANYSPRGNKLGFRWWHGAFTRDDDLPADYAAELSQAIKASGENSAFLACLRERAEQGDGRAVGPSPGPNYAPAQFEGMTQAKGLKKAALKRAMDRLFSICAIESYTYRNTAKGRDVTVIREAGEASPNASPNASRTLVPNVPHQSARTTPHTHSSTTYVSGAASGAAAPNSLSVGQ